MSLVLAGICSVLVGTWVPLVYAVLNDAGVWIGCSGRRGRRERWAKLLAILLLPVGFLCAMKPDGKTPSEAAAFASGDERVRQAAARATHPGGGGPGT